MSAPTIPASLAPEFVERERRFDKAKREFERDDVLDALADAMRAARADAEKIAAAADAIMADATHTRAANAKRTRDHALKVAEGAARRLDVATKAATETLAEIAAGTTTPAAPEDEVGLGIERSMIERFATMDAAARSKIISAALERGDDATLGAALRGPAWLVGMSDTEQATHREKWRRKRFPDLCERADRIKRAVAATERGGQLLVEFADSFSGSDAAHAERTAAAATAALATSTGGE